MWTSGFTSRSRGERWFAPKARKVEKPLVRFSGRQLRQLFGQFIEHRVYKRQLRRSEVPHIWRWAPLPIMERLMGQVLVLKAFKPLSSALPLPLAA